MPKGVEHYIFGANTLHGMLDVNSSLMPKGVEHSPSAIIRRPDCHVNSSLMPKGVEHLSEWDTLEDATR